jgi:uncharacterized protein YjiS (DUF1127 family)
MTTAHNALLATRYAGMRGTAAFPHSQSLRRSLFARLLAAFHGWLTETATRISRREQAHALRQLDDRILADIGLVRSEIGLLPGPESDRSSIIGFDYRTTKDMQPPGQTVTVGKS